MKKPRPFRFGIGSSGASTREAWVAMARKVESMGYSTLVIGDHLFDQMGPVSALVAAADATSTLRLGSSMFANDFRHPVFLAQEAATIDLLSSGRFELGLGTGWYRSDYDQLGILFDTPGVRVARMMEAVQIVKGLWAEGTFTFTGAYYKVNQLNGLPKPAQKPRPPIMIGGGSQRILSFAAREADVISLNIKTTRDGWVDFSTITAEATDQKVKWVREAAEDRFDVLEINNATLIENITDQRRQGVLQGIQALRDMGFALEDANVDQWLASPMVLVGTVNQIVEDLQLRRERFGISYIVLGENVMDAFAPVVERLAGK